MWEEMGGDWDLECVRDGSLSLRLKAERTQDIDGEGDVHVKSEHRARAHVSAPAPLSIFASAHVRGTISKMRRDGLEAENKKMGAGG